MAGGELRRWKCPTTDVVDDTPSPHGAFEKLREWTVVGAKPELRNAT